MVTISRIRGDVEGGYVCLTGENWPEKGLRYSCLRFFCSPLSRNPNHQSSSSKRGIEIKALIKQVDFDRGLGGRREGTRYGEDGEHEG